jgi:hypothetical protein
VPAIRPVIRRAILTATAVLAMCTPALVAAPGAAAAGPGVPLTKGAVCLPGTWSLNLPNSPAGLSGATTTSEGAVTIKFGPGHQFLQTYASAISTGQPGPGGTYLQTRQEVTGTISATWKATVRKLTLTHVRNDTTSVSTVSIDDRTSDPATEKPAPETFAPKRQTVSYRCSGDTLRLDTLGGIAQGYTRTG